MSGLASAAGTYEVAEGKDAYVRRSCFVGDGWEQEDDMTSGDASESGSIVTAPRRVVQKGRNGTWRSLACRVSPETRGWRWRESPRW